MHTILITGCNRGIGLELCRQLAGRGDRIIATCRQSSAELATLDVQLIEHVDVGSDESIAGLRQAIGNTRLDWLINNAGILDRDSLNNLDWQQISRQLEINAVGPLRVTAALRDNLAAGSKIGIVTSRMGSIEDNTSGGYYGYRMSKVAVNMVGKSLSQDLKADQISVALLHPGMVATEMTGGQGIPISQSAKGLIQRMDELEPDTSGSFWHAEGYPLPW